MSTGLSASPGRCGLDRCPKAVSVHSRRRPRRDSVDGEREECIPARPAPRRRGRGGSLASAQDRHLPALVLAPGEANVARSGNRRGGDANWFRKRIRGMLVTSNSRTRRAMRSTGTWQSTTMCLASSCRTAVQQRTCGPFDVGSSLPLAEQVTEGIFPACAGRHSCTVPPDQKGNDSCGLVARELRGRRFC